MRKGRKGGKGKRETRRGGNACETRGLQNRDKLKQLTPLLHVDLIESGYFRAFVVLDGLRWQT